jgi:phage gp29-like protein
MAVRSGGVGIGTTETDMQILNGAAAGNKDAFEAFQRYCDEIIAIVILGQLASSDSASGLSKGSAQEKVRQDILESDVLMLQEALQNLINHFCQLRYGWPDADDVEILFDYQPPENLNEKAQMFSTLAQAARRPLDPKQVYDEFGVKLGEEIVERFDQELELSDKGKKKSGGREALVRAALERMIDDEALAAWQLSIERAQQAAFADLDPDDPDLMESFKRRVPAFLAALPGLMDEFSTGDFEQALSGAMLAGALNGALTG